jgi:hypothetical protein
VSAAAEFIEAHPEVEARIVIDRFHVAQNYRADLDALRKQEFRPQACLHDSSILLIHKIIQ